MQKKYIECGKIVSTHGIRGEMKMQPHTNDPAFLLDFPTLYLDQGVTPLKVKGARIHKNMVLLTVEGVNSIEDASPYRGKQIFIDRADDTDDRPFLQDFMGIRVMDADTNQDYGTIVDIIQTGANDVYVLKDKQNIQRLVPDIPPVVLETDFDTEVMKIRPLKGLFDDAD